MAWKGFVVEQEIWCLAWWADNGPPGNMWLGSLKSAWVPDRWIIRKFRRKLCWWDRRLKPYPGVVCNGLFGFPGCGGGQVKCAQLHCSDINICRPLHNDDIVH